MTDALQLRDNARYELEQIKDLESGIDYLNKVKAIETWAKAEKKDAELQNMIAEQKLRTQRVLGNLIKEGQKTGEVRSQDSGRPKERLEVDFNTAKDRLDQRKEFLKTLRSPTPIGDTVTGELVTVNPPLMKSTAGVKVTIQ